MGLTLAENRKKINSHESTANPLTLLDLFLSLSRRLSASSGKWAFIFPTEDATLFNNKKK